MTDQETLLDWYRSFYVQGQGLLVSLVQTHLEIDPPTRILRSEDPNWIARLRKVLHHARAITSWEISTDVEHVIAPELRAAYRQMEFIWKELPDRGEIYEWYRDYWSAEANKLGRYDHPTGYNLHFTLFDGVFSVDRTKILAQFAEWLHRLGLGYALALDYLSQTLDNENYEITTTRLAEILRMYPVEPPEA